MSDPKISVVIPCFNEEKNIEALLEAIRGQSVSLEELEVIIADGFSTDKTRQLIMAYAALHSELDIHIIDNEKKVIPAGLNKAIRAAKGTIIVRMDAHTIPANDYIKRSVDSLSAGLGDNVGGVIDIRPGKDTWIGRSIAIATAHPLGVGDAKYRTAKTAGEADTVAFGCYYKATVEKVGYYNEKLYINEDYEFNTRLRALRMKIWVDPAIRTIYYSRASLWALAKQYFAYGFWKVRMLKKYPKTLRWRQALPPIFVLGILMLLLLSIFWLPAIWIFFGFVITYTLILAIGSLRQTIKQKEFRLEFGIPLAIMTMHFSWGSGFWWSVLGGEQKDK